LLVNRGPEWLTALLAVFKAGGIYLPLDPLHPAPRLRQVLDQSRVELVLTTKQFASELGNAVDDPLAAGPRVLQIAELLQQENSEENLEYCSQENDLAYVIYTSGSTGIPKGAMIEHAGMLNHLSAKISDLQLGKTDIVAQTASQCFDISVWQLLAPLLVGGQVRIVSDEVAHDPLALLALIQRENITILETVPSLLATLVNELATATSGQLPSLSLKWLLVTGEALSPELCRRWLSFYPDIPLLNAYGPTECSDDVTHHPIARAPGSEVVRMPIGRPLINTQLYVLDQVLRPVPIGVTGELYVGGRGVGRGYLNDAERTAEVFIADPFSAEPGRRLYRTGDLARYLPDANIEFLGRVDYQVKLRGFRIEPGEIEAVLDQHPNVRSCAVVLREDLPNESRLVAYLVSEDQPLSIDSLRSYLRERLPDYMVPAAFVMLAELPLTANGKVDRQALPLPDWNSQELKDSFVAPRSDVEETLAAIWRDLLGIERVGVYDNFFYLGGHSLLATQLISRVNNAFRVKLVLRTVFESPTVAALTVAIVQTMLEPESAEDIDRWFESLEEILADEATPILETDEINM
jgi:amino acid adenylation domain-containing protein